MDCSARDFAGHASNNGKGCALQGPTRRPYIIASEHTAKTDGIQNWTYREHPDSIVFLQAVALTWHIHKAVHSGHGDLDDIFKIFAFGAIAGSQGLFGQIPNQ